MFKVLDRYRNKLVYDANTGELRDDRKFMNMLEDYWFPAVKVVKAQKFPHCRVVKTGRNGRCPVFEKNYKAKYSTAA